METPAPKRIFSEIKPEFDYHFICWFDAVVRIEEEVQEAKRHCNTNEVVCDRQPGQDFAIVKRKGRVGRTESDGCRVYAVVFD